MANPGFFLHCFCFASACCSFLPFEGLAVPEVCVLIITAISGPFDSLTLRIVIAYARSLGYAVIDISSGLGLCGGIDDLCCRSVEVIISLQELWTN